MGGQTWFLCRGKVDGQVEGGSVGEIGWEWGGGHTEEPEGYEDPGSRIL